MTGGAPDSQRARGTAGCGEPCPICCGLQASVAACFARNVSQRPTAAKLAETWCRLLRGDDGTAQAEAMQAAAQGSESSGSSEVRVEADSSVLQW